MDPYRLPTDVKPTNYDLTIRTDLEQAKFDGVVRIDFEVQRETSTIVLNVVGLRVDVATERGIFTFSRNLPAESKAQLRIAFAGDLTGNTAGYFRSISKAEGKAKYSSLTHFEAFPCWDEPALKATFVITLVSHDYTTNLSNMPVSSGTTYDPKLPIEEGHVGTWLSKKLSQSATDDLIAQKWKITRFEATPPMSTYFVAFANGQYKYLESSYTSPLSGKVHPLRVYTSPEFIEGARFALEVSRRVLPIYEQMFGIEYPLPKLDTLIVHDFFSVYLLDPKKADLAFKQQIGSRQAHEVAHMWVMIEVITMMTVAYPQRFSYGIFPEWSPQTKFLSGRYASALDLDAKLSSHPVEVECTDANKIVQIFDELSYAKGASVLRMLADYVGEERFLNGVSIYLKHLYSNTVTADLWEGIAAATGRDIPRTMDNWIKKGFPVVTVTENLDGVHIRQDRFLETGPPEPKDNETIWTIPLSILSVSEEGQTVVDKELILDTREKTIFVDTKKLFKLNANTVGFFRVLYTPERLVAIGTEAAKSPSPFSVADRIGLVSDALALTKAGYASVSSALSLIDALRDEQEFLVWQCIGNSFIEIESTWWEHPDVIKLLNEFRRELFAPIVERLGYTYFEDEALTTRELRTLAITQTSGADDEGVVRQLQGWFAHYESTGDDTVIPADLVLETFRTAIRKGGRKEWEFVKKIASNPLSATFSVPAMRTMGAVQDQQLAEDTFRYILIEVRNEDCWYFVEELQTHGYHLETAQGYEAYIGLCSRDLLAFKSLSSTQDHDDIVEYFKDKDTAKYDMALKQSLENILTRAAWIQRSTGDILNWLETRNQRK
ncbi:ERAP1-like C-terminal domain-containing protein [Sparassis latifolia]